MARLPLRTDSGAPDVAQSLQANKDRVLLPDFKDSDSETPAEVSLAETRAVFPGSREPVASATPTATPSVLLLLSGTTTRQPVPLFLPEPVDRWT